MSNLWLDLKCALRSFRRRRALTLLVVGTLALGVGAVTAVFMVAQSVLIRPLPYANADSVAMIWRKPLNRPSVMSGFRDENELNRQIATNIMVQTWRTQAKSFADIAAIESWRGNLSAQPDLITASGAERLHGAFATPNLFDLLGVQASLGRVFVEGDEDTVVISHAFWQRQFGGDAAVIGRTLDIVADRPRVRKAFTIAGVLPPAFRFTYPDETEVWMVLPWQAVASRMKGALLYQVAARLRPGVTLDQASAEVAAMSAVQEDARKAPIDRRDTAWVESIHEYTIGRVRPAIVLLAALCGTVLLIGCLSAASLLIAQSSSRRNELLTQRILGASRARIASQLLIETAAITAVATSVAVAVVAALQPIIRSMVPIATPRADEIGIGAATVIWTAIVAGIVVVLTGFLPAWLAVRQDPRIGLLQSRAATTGFARVRLRQLLIATQVAFVTPLIIAAGLLLHSFWNLRHVDMGFQDDSIVVAEMRLLDPRYRDAAQLRTFETSLVDGVRRVSGVVDASITSAIPLRGVDWLRSLSKPDGSQVSANERQVEPNYFHVMQIPLVAGRYLEATDVKESPAVVVISQAFASWLYPDGNALGQFLDVGKDRSQVVGIVADVRSRRVEDTGAPSYYLPRAQSSSELVCLIAKVEGSPDAVKAAIPTIVRTIDPEQPVQGMKTLDQVVSESIDSQRVYAVASGALATVTLLLTLAGVCGVLFQLVTERTRELGIRAAIGAGPRHLLQSVLAQGMTPLMVGVLFGSVGSYWLTILIRRFLFDVSGVDAAAYAATVAGVIVCGLIACYLPGRRAARLDAAAALRHD